MYHDRVSQSSIVEIDAQRSTLRDCVAQLVEKFGRSYFQDVAQRGEKPTELWSALGSAGYLGVHLPEEYGGGGGGLQDLTVVIEEVAAHGCPLMLAVSSLSIAGTILNAHGSDVLKKRWLPGIANGQAIVVFAITEPDAGTNTHNIKTTATPNPDGGWRLNGAKYWTTGVDEAAAILVVARSPEPDANGRSRLSLFLVDPDAPGLSKRKLDSALAGPEKSFMVFFDDVPVEADSLVGVEGEGLKQVFAGLNPERVAAAALGNGIARYALDRGVRYANERTVWSQPIGAHQGVSHPLAHAYVDLQLARLMTARAAELYDNGADAGEAANIAKLVSAESALKAVDDAMQVHGGNGLSTEFGLADLWFTARMLRIAPVSKEMVLNHIAQHSLGLPKSY